MKYLLIVLTMLLATAPAHAIDDGGNYAVWGVGSKSCFHYNKARETDKYDDYMNYIKGFLTAMNITEPETYSISGKMPFSEILAWLDDTCELKQTHSIEQALLEFIEEHYESRLRRARTSAGR